MGVGILGGRGVDIPGSDRYPRGRYPGNRYPRGRGRCTSSHSGTDT